MNAITTSLLEVFERLLRRQRSPLSATRHFRDWKHDRHILPKLQEQLDTVLVALKKFEPVVYNTQGILDHGTDIAVSYKTSDEGDEQKELIGFQVKSYDDLSKSDYMKDLKAQTYDSFNTVRGLRYYFILLCTDAEEHAMKIQNINAAFRSTERTKVIEPRFAYTFLKSPATTAEAFVKRTMEADDLVFRKALDSLDQPSPSAQGLAIFLAVKSVLTGQQEFSQAELIRDSGLRRIYDGLREKQAELMEGALEDDEPQESDTRDREMDDEDDLHEEDDAEMVRVAEFEPQITEDFETLEADLIDRDSGSDSFIMKTDQLRALNAVIADALARYEYSESELMAYMLSIMGILD
jgi:uncharacterized protein DUF4365